MAEAARNTRGDGARSTPEIVRAVATDTTALIKAEAELARHELVEAVTARLKGAGAFAAAGAVAFLAIVFAGAAASQALQAVVSPWLASLIVAGGFALLAIIAAAIGMPKMKNPSLAPQETVRTVKEEVGWAKDQLKR